jgi:NitT/TauT family transport system substrate-binding protein
VEPTAASTAAVDLVIPKPSGNLSFKVGHSELDINDMPTKVTVDRLNSQGWDIELVEFSAVDLLNQGLAQGTVSFTNGSLLDPLRAYQAGAAVSWTMENNGGEYVLVVKSEYADCAALDGKRFGMNGETSSSSVAGRSFVEDCGATVESVIIPGGDNRVVALLNDQLDATVVQLADWLDLQKQAPDDFKVLDTADLFTTISGSAIWVNKQWASENEDVAVAFLAETLKTFRMIREDPTILEESIKENVPDYPEDLIAPAVQAYIDLVGAWPVNGGDDNMVADAISFFTEKGDLTAGLELSDVASEEWLSQALDIIGTVPDAR